jgi:alanine racemase
MISLYDILEASNGQLFGEPGAQIFSDFCLDSRQAKESQLFVAMRTDHGDTHQYIEEAIQNGVSGVICTHPPECNTDGISVIISRNVPAALMSWAHYFLGKLGTHVIGVTGSVGKSVTIDAITKILATQYAVHQSSVSYQGTLSVPLTLAKLTPEHNIVVLKLGTQQPGEMGEMIQAVQPETGVITYSGLANLDHFVTPERLAKEHGILVELLSPTGLAVLNYDNDLVREMPTRAKITTFGIDRFGADLMAYNILIGPSGTGFDLRHGGDRFVGRWVPLLGKQFLYSILAALAVGLHYGIKLEDGLEAISDLPQLPGHMNPFTGINSSLIIDDTYDANPDSTLAALDWLEAAKDETQRTIFVMGDMDHLGAYAQRGHRIIGQRAAQVADVIITHGMDAALIGRAALDQGMDPKNIATVYSTQDVVTTLKNNFSLTDRDTILVKGGASNHMESVVRLLLADQSQSDQLIQRKATLSANTVFQSPRPSWVEIDTKAMAGNVRALKKIIGDEVKLMAVVKANAYGHGAVTASRTALLNGAEYLAVASISEALELRDAGIDAPILVLSYTPVHTIHQAIRQNLTVMVYDLEMAQAYNRQAQDLDSNLLVHVKVDTGMARLGVPPKEAVAFFRQMMTMKNLEIEGIYSHFSMADDPSAEFTETQLNVFNSILRPLRAAGFSFKYIHLANSAATLTNPSTHFNMVRTGIALYGLSPSDKVPLPEDFAPVMSWKTVIAQIQNLPSGHPVGYGNTYYTSADEQIAIIPVGYADGFRRAPNHWAEVLVHGQRAPVVGRVGMEKTAINVTHIQGVSIGDEVVLMGRQGDDIITADAIAASLGTINYEVVCSALPRVPRR